jgi:hypothetical protein
MLFAASAAPFDSLAAARQSLRENREEFARLGFHRIEDFAPTRLLDEAGVRALAEGGIPNTDDRNFLAARAARLGDATLAPPSARVLWKKLDPLLSGTDGLDRGALIRRLVSTNHAERAKALAMTEDGALQETALGWIEIGQARLGRAVRHFERALALAPDSRDALAGLMTSRSFDLTQGTPVEGLSEANLDPQLAAVITGWRRAALSDWERVAALESELAGFQPGDALFPEASRLRASWRVAGKDPEANAEAQQIAATLLARQWTAADALLYARAAIAAGHPRDAWGALNQIARSARRNPAVGKQVAAALGLAAQLPEDLRRDVNERLQKASAGEPPDEEGERVID